MERQRRRAKGDIVSLCDSGLDTGTVLRETTRRICQVSPYDHACWYTVDPSTLLLTGGSGENLGHEPRLPRYEYEVPDVNKWLHLARRESPVGVLSHATHGCPEASPRFRDLLRPRGIAHELRASLVSGGTCWGFLAVFRDRGRPDFTERDAAFFAEVDTFVADGVRRALLLDAPGPRADPGLHGVLLLDEAGEVTQMNAAAEKLVRLLPGCQGPLPDSVLSVAAQARRGSAGREPARAWSRTRTVGGQWIVLHGTQLGGRPGAATAVTLEHARPSELAELVVLAHGLTAREREVTRNVILGHSTAQIAAELRLSPFTVQDHLKAIFDKVGVRSRRELIATVLRDIEWPRMLADEAPQEDGGRAGLPPSPAVKG